jgi:hypothetical protein
MPNSWRKLVFLPLLLPLAACMPQPAAPVVGGNEAVAPIPEPAKPTPPTPVLSTRDAARKFAATPATALNVRTECRFKDETGYGGSLDLQVVDANIKRLKAEVTIPKRGVCRFDLAKFRQTRTLPSPVLSAKDTKCRIFVWEQGDTVTVAFHACQASCTGTAFSYLWPILVYRKKGECA